MLPSAETMFMLVSLVTYTSSFNGNYYVNQISSPTLNFKQASMTTKVMFKIEKEGGESLHLERPQQTDFQRSKGIYQELKFQTDVPETPAVESKKVEDLLLTSDVKGKKISITVQPLTNKQDHHKWTVKNYIQIKMGENRGPNFENGMSLLWRRTSPTREEMSEKVYSKASSSPSASHPPSKLKQTLNAISESFVKAKQKVMGPHSTISSYSYINKSISMNTSKRSSGKKAPSGHLTSGYTKKPSPSSQVPAAEYQGDQVFASYFSSPQPSKQAQTEDTLGLRSSQQPTRNSRQDAYDDESPPPSPMKSPEVNDIWDFINRHSKKWAESTPPHKESMQAKERKTGYVSVPQSSRRSPTGTKPDVNTAQIKSTASTVKPHNSSLQEEESQADKRVEEYIASHKNSWKTPVGLGDVPENSQPATQRLPSPPKTVASKPSPPKTVASKLSPQKTVARKLSPPRSSIQRHSKVSWQKSKKHNRKKIIKH